jgi:hypothetical protein
MQRTAKNMQLYTSLNNGLSMTLISQPCRRQDVCCYAAPACNRSSRSDGLHLCACCAHGKIKSSERAATYCFKGSCVVLLGHQDCNSRELCSLATCLYNMLHIYMQRNHNAPSLSTEQSADPSLGWIACSDPLLLQLQQSGPDGKPRCGQLYGSCARAAADEWLHICKLHQLNDHRYQPRLRCHSVQQ